MATYKIVALILIWCSSQNYGFRINRNRRFSEVENKAFKYLSKYGFYAGWIKSKGGLKIALEEFQIFNHLNVTMIPDEPTMVKLVQTRCGTADPLRVNRHSLKAYNTHPTFWKKRTISWRLTKETTNNATLKEVTHSEIRSVFRRAFETWQEAAYDIEFTETDGDADIRIEFNSQFHNDPFPFDGKGEAIAHAFYPYNGKQFSGDIHLDDSETYTLAFNNTTDGINLFWVALHEIGHSLGVLHSMVIDSIMNPWYNKSNPILKLHEYDIEAIRHIYPEKISHIVPDSGISPEADVPFAMMMAPSKTSTSQVTQYEFQSDLPYYLDILRTMNSCEKTVRESCCVLPFQYKGKVVKECIMEDNNQRKWCTTTTDYDNNKEWDNCVL